MASCLTLEEIILKLYDIGVFKFGDFQVRTGEHTPFYINMRVIWSFPDVVRAVAEHIVGKMKQCGQPYNTICGIPYQGIPLASHICTSENIPMLLKRKKAKDYGTKQLFEGYYDDQTKVVLVDDVLMTGGTIVENIPEFEEAGMKVVGVFCFIDREQGGKERVKHVNHVNAFSCVTLTKAFDILLKAGKVSQSDVDKTMDYIRANRFDTAQYGCGDVENLDEINGKVKN